MWLHLNSTAPCAMPSVMWPLPLKSDFFNTNQCTHNNVNQCCSHPPQCKLSAWHFPLLSVIMRANYFPIMITQWGGSYQNKSVVFFLPQIVALAVSSPVHCDSVGSTYGLCGLSWYGFFSPNSFVFLLFLSLTVVLQARLLSVTVATDFAHCHRVNPVIGYVASVYGESDCLLAPPCGF